jgi:phosphotransferase system HPr-like phosphotransfer protein
MKTYKIRLKTIDDVRNFVNAVTAIECDVDLASGRYVVDAKSIMGIFSLDLAKEIDMTVHCDCCLEKVEEKLKEYIVG